MEALLFETKQLLQIELIESSTLSPEEWIERFSERFENLLKLAASDTQIKGAYIDK